MPKRARDKGDKKSAYSPLLVAGNAGPYKLNTSTFFGFSVMPTPPVNPSSDGFQSSTETL